MVFVTAGFGAGGGRGSSGAAGSGCAHDQGWLTGAEGGAGGTAMGGGVAMDGSGSFGASASVGSSEMLASSRPASGGVMAVIVSTISSCESAGIVSTPAGVPDHGAPGIGAAGAEDTSPAGPGGMG